MLEGTPQSGAESDKIEEIEFTDALLIEADAPVVQAEAPAAPSAQSDVTLSTQAPTQYFIPDFALLPVTDADTVQNLKRHSRYFGEQPPALCLTKNWQDSFLERNNTYHFTPPSTLPDSPVPVAEPAPPADLAEAADAGAYYFMTPDDFDLADSTQATNVEPVVVADLEEAVVETLVSDTAAVPVPADVPPSEEAPQSFVTVVDVEAAGSPQSEVVASAGEASPSSQADFIFSGSLSFQSAQVLVPVLQQGDKSAAPVQTDLPVTRLTAAPAPTSAASVAPHRSVASGTARSDEPGVLTATSAEFPAEISVAQHASTQPAEKPQTQPQTIVVDARVTDKVSQSAATIQAAGTQAPRNESLRGKNEQDAVVAQMSGRTVTGTESQGNPGDHRDDQKPFDFDGVYAEAVMKKPASVVTAQTADANLPTFIPSDAYVG